MKNQEPEEESQFPLYVLSLEELETIMRTFPDRFLCSTVHRRWEDGKEEFRMWDGKVWLRES